MKHLEVGYRLAPRARRRLAEALLVPVGDVGRVLRLLASETAGPAICVFGIANGFLLRGDEPIGLPVAGTIGLGRLGGNLYLPVDADLSPALLPDEVAGLTRDRGLIFLPGGRILWFDPDRPVPIAELLTVSRITRLETVRLPAVDRRADRIIEILFEPPSEEGGDPLESASGEIGTEESEPEAGSSAGTAAGRAAFGGGKGLVWLGSKLNVEGLARLGARWMDAAAGLAPRVSEALLGRQERALRALLREFREGSIDKALRRALPLSSGNERGPATPGGDRLPEHDLRYSLQNLLGGAPGKGGGSYWFGSLDLRRELTREYEKAAEEAARRGDHRRAAFIHARLLGDFRAAANVLARGGLHHDAALVLLDRVGDVFGAARAFEAAGEADRALRIYRSERAHEVAGDLLKRLGDDEAALAEYVLAAEALTLQNSGHLAAGQLLAGKGNRDDLALRHFATGWAERPFGSAVACARAMAAIHGRSGAEADLLALAVEADEFFGAPEQNLVGVAFYNDLAALADLPALVARRDELRDRALLGLARELRHPSGGFKGEGMAVGRLFPAAGPWPADLVRDAEFAAAARSGFQPQSGRPTTRQVRLATGLVTAVARASETDELFVGFHGGDVYRYRPTDGATTRVGSYAIPVAGLAVDPAGSFLVVLWKSETADSVVAAYARRPGGDLEMTEGRAEPRGDGLGLAGGVVAEVEPLAGLQTDGRLGLLRGRSLVVEARIDLGDAVEPDVVLLRSAGELLAIGVGADGRWFRAAVDREPIACRSVGWTPAAVPAPGSGLAGPAFDWIQAPHARLEVAGVDTSGTLYRTVFWIGTDEAEGPRFEAVATNISASDLGYRCACLIRPGYVAAVLPRSVQIVRGVSNRFTTIANIERDLAPAVACMPCHRTREVLVVTRDGTIEHVAAPGF